MFKRVPSAGTKADSDLLPIAPTSSPTIGKHLCKSGNLRISIFKLQSGLSAGCQIIYYDIISNYRRTKVIYWYGCAQKKLDCSFQNRSV